MMMMLNVNDDEEEDDDTTSTRTTTTMMVVVVVMAVMNGDDNDNGGDNDDDNNQSDVKIEKMRLGNTKPVAQLVSSWILTSCQPHRVISGRSVTQTDTRTNKQANYTNKTKCSDATCA